MNEPLLSSTVQSTVNKTSITLKKSLNFENKSSQQEKLLSMHTKKNQIKNQIFTNDIEKISENKSENSTMLLNLKVEERNDTFLYNSTLNDSLKESKKSQFDDIPNNRIDKNIEIQNVKNSIELNKNTTTLNLILPVGSSTIQMDSKNQQKNREIYPNSAISKINIEVSKIKNKASNILEKKYQINDMKKSKYKINNDLKSGFEGLPDHLKNMTGHTQNLSRERTVSATVLTKQISNPDQTLKSKIDCTVEKVQFSALNDSKDHFDEISVYEMMGNRNVDTAIDDMEDESVSVSVSVSVSDGNGNNDGDRKSVV